MDRRPGACAMICGLVMVCGCDSRPAPLGDAARDWTPGAVDGPRADGARADRPAIDRAMHRDGPLDFCGGQPTAIVDGTALPVAQVKTGIQSTASCCGPGEMIRFMGTDASGKTFELGFSMLRFPSTPTVTHLDLGSPPSGWFLSVDCQPSSLCGGPYVRPDNSSFTGTVDLAPAGAIPQETLTLCLSTTPKPTSSAKPVKLSVTGVLVHLVCAPGMDQMCNNDPSISSLRGTCNEDSTCTCNSGSPLPTTGKCL
jgi:hypothetical protein